MRFIAEVNDKLEGFDDSYLLSEEHIWEIQADYK